MFNNNNNYPFRGVLGGMAPGGAQGFPPARTMFSSGAGVRPNMGGEMNFGQFGSQGQRAGYPGLPADFGYTPPWMVGGPGKNMNNFPGILSGGFNRRGF